jgi:hypothetical protein
MIAAGLLYLGLFALAAGMPRHTHRLLGRWHIVRPVHYAPVLGWSLILLSLLAALVVRDWPRALVAWFGLMPVMAGTLLLGLTFGAGIARTGAAFAVALVIAGSFA